MQKKKALGSKATASVAGDSVAGFPQQLSEGKSIKNKIIDTINKMDDASIEQLGAKLHLKQQDELTEANIQALGEEEEKSTVVQAPQGPFHGLEEKSLVSASGVSQQTGKSYISNYSYINKLENQLKEEKEQREKLQSEIEELKKISSELQDAVLS